MSRIESYKCDYCNAIIEAEAIVGVSAQEDLLDKLRSYPTIVDPKKAEIHYCLKCYDSNVIQAAIRSGVNLKTDQAGYAAKIAEFSLLLRSSTISRYRKNKFH